ncbi:MAG: ABC-type transport auxiliary lipoprotein family protein [Rhodospirillales bacterium]|nr:ABC-type transport auxiliary lipoprotein family protein [Rhodospirillales bacterium]
MTLIRSLLIAIGAAGLAACSQPPVPQDHFYRLQVLAPESAMSQPKLDGTLEVARLVADGLTAGRPIVFSEAASPLEVSEYHYHFWTEPPTVMLHDELVTYLRAANVARSITTPQLRLEPDYVLTGKIKRLEQVRGTPTKVAAVIELALRDRRDDRLLMVKTYSVENETEGPGVAAAVRSLNAAMASIYQRFVADLSGL